MPTIIVEDGTIVANANSYIDVTYLNAFATDRGFTLPSTTNEKEILIIKAMDYLEAKCFKGEKSIADQELQWPRDNVYIDCELLNTDVIPEVLKRALAQLVVEQHLGTALYPVPRTSTVQGFVTQKTVGPLTKKFSAFGGTVSSITPITIASVELFLQSILGSCCGNGLRTVRI